MSLCLRERFPPCLLNVCVKPCLNCHQIIERTTCNGYNWNFSCSNCLEFWELTRANAGFRDARYNMDFALMRARFFQGLLVFAIVPVLVTAIWGGVIPSDWRRTPIQRPNVDTLQAERDYVRSLLDDSRFVFFQEEGLNLQGGDTQFSTAGPGDWRAVDTKGQLTDELRPGYIMLTPAGDAEGTLLTLDGQGAVGMTVYLMQSGRMVGTSNTDSNGAFKIVRVDPGVYSLIAIGDGGLAVFAMACIPYQDVEDYEPGLETFVVPAPYDFVLSTLEGGFPSMRDSAVDEPKYLEMAKPVEDGGDVPQQFQGLRELLRKVHSGQQQTTLQAHPALINPDKVLWGRVIGIERVTGRPMVIDEMTVHLLNKDGSVHDSCEVDDRGVFHFENVDAGNYGLMGSGADGFFVVGLHTENLPAEAASNRPFLNDFFVGAQGSNNTATVAPITNPDDIQGAVNQEQQGEGAPPAGGTQAPPQGQTGSSSGGGGGGGGGFGAAAGAVGGIIGAAALAQGDDATATPSGSTTTSQ